MRLSNLILALTLATGATAQTHLGKVSIDNVTHTYNDGGVMKLGSNYIHRVSIRYDFRSCASGVNWFGANAFKVYSPDGADWGYLKVSDGPLVTSLPPTTAISRRTYYSTNDGSTWPLVGTDSAAGSGGAATRAAYRLSLIDMTGGGFVGGSDNGIAVILEFTSREEDNGRRICVDSLNIQGSSWSWSAPSTTEDRPRWDNGLGASSPRCFEIWHLPCAEYNGPVQKVPTRGPDCNPCCKYRVGDANGSGDDMPTLGDVSAMIDAKFITGSCDGVLGPCLAEADINRSGGDYPTCDDITIGDITQLINYLFVTGPETGSLPDCL